METPNDVSGTDQLNEAAENKRRRTLTENYGDDPLFTSPLAPERKRQRKAKSEDRISSLDIALDEDDDRGIPGASKVASPFYQDPRHFRARVKRHNYSHKYNRPRGTQTTTSQTDFEAAFNEAYESLKDEDDPTQSFQDQRTSRSFRLSDETLSPGALFAGEPQMSPGDLSQISEMSHDGQQMLWEPLAEDMKDHLMDHDRLRPISETSHDGHQMVCEPLAINLHGHLIDHDRYRPSSNATDLNGSPSNATLLTVKSESSCIQTEKSDSHLSQKKRVFFPDSLD
jgi:hypothetical protein